MQVKQLGRVEIKNADRGEVSAVFATFNVLDSDDDVTLPGAFEEGAERPISAYGHTSWQGVLPVGTAKIRMTDTEAILDGQFWMDIPHARDTFLAVKRLHERGQGQWSYGYDPIEWHMGEWNGRKARFLVKQEVHEFSPVLVGAGAGTRTLSAKGLLLGITPHEALATAIADYKSAIRPHDIATTGSDWDAGAAAASIPDDATVSDLRSVFAWVAAGADPEAKASYKFPHHTRVGGPANIRACVAGIAALNGARGGASIPASDRQGVYAHLAAHLRAAGREPPELRDAKAGGAKTLSDELAGFLAESDAVIESVARVVALRAERGKQLSGVNTEILGWIDANLHRLRALLNPQDELAYQYARFVRTLRGDVQ